MALIVEDGSIVSGANSYVSLADANSYVTDRGFEVTLTEGQLLRGADYINSYRDRFKGEKRTAIASNMQFPRSNVDLDGNTVPPTVIPDLLIEAQIETALEIANNRDPNATMSTQIVKKRRVGDLEIEYDTKAGTEIPDYEYRKIDNLLQPILIDSAFRVYR